MEQMKHAIVRGMWGDITASRRHAYPPITYERLVKDATESVTRPDIHDAIYCFGTQNAELFRSLGSDVHLIDERPWMTPRLTDEIDQHGMVRYGANTFWHKLMILDVALQDYDAVVWIDFHMTQLKDSLPDDFWQFLHDGPEFQAALSMQRSTTHGAGWRRWRKKRWPKMPLWEGPEDDQMMQARIIPQCAWMYLRGRSIIEEALEIQREWPRWMDQQVFACVLDNRNDGHWMGVPRYIRDRYNSPSAWYFYCNLLYPPSERDTYWQHGDRRDALSIDVRNSLHTIPMT